MMTLLLGMKLTIAVSAVYHCWTVSGEGLQMDVACNDTQCNGRFCLNGTCETECKDGHYGPGCRYACSQGCLAGRCRESNVGTGVCTEGCHSGFWGETCSFRCPHLCKTCLRETGKTCSSCKEFHYGILCKENCRRSCSRFGCKMDGSCKPLATACDNGKFGTNCQWGCSKGCAYDVCNRTSGICLHGCQSGYFGDKCEFICNPNCDNQVCDNEGMCIQGCRIGYYGGDCIFRCGPNCRLFLCDRDSGDCVNGCSDGYFGTQCNMTCSSGCLVCHGRTGECVHTSTYSTSTAKEDGGNEPISTGYYILGIGAAILGVSVAVVFIIRRWNVLRAQEENKLERPRKLPDLPVELYSFGYSEINEKEVDLTSQKDSLGSTEDASALAAQDESKTMTIEIPDREEDSAEGQILSADGHENTSSVMLSPQTDGVVENCTYRKIRFKKSNVNHDGESNLKYMIPVINEGDLKSTNKYSERFCLKV